jgi:hypothetical protein
VTQPHAANRTKACHSSRPTRKADAPLPHERTPSPRLRAAGSAFTRLLSSTRRGARLARLLAAEQLRACEVPSGVVERAEQVVAELAANAVFHGRDFRPGLPHDVALARIRIEHLTLPDACLTARAGKTGGADRPCGGTIRHAPG